MAFEVFKKFIARKEAAGDSQEKQLSDEDVRNELQRELHELEIDLASSENIPREMQSEARAMLGKGDQVSNNVNAFWGIAERSAELHQSMKEANVFLPKVIAMRASIREYLPARRVEKSEEV